MTQALMVEPPGNIKNNYKKGYRLKIIKNYLKQDNNNKNDKTDKIMPYLVIVILYGLNKCVI